MKRVLGTLFVGATVFAGGIISGMLLSPANGKANRRWLSKQSKETKQWLEEQLLKLKEERKERLSQWSQGVKKTFEDTVPNLYEATADLGFSEAEEIEEITRHG